MSASPSAASVAKRVIRAAHSAAASLVRRVVLATLAAAILPALAAWLGKRLVDAVVAGERSDAIWLLGAEAVVMVLLAVALQGAQLTKRLLGLRLGDTLRGRIASKASSLTLATLETPRVQDQLTRSRKQAGSRPMLYVERLLSIAKGALALAVAGTLLAGVHPVALIVVMLAGAPALLVTFRFARRHHDLEGRRTAMRREQSYLENVLSREDHAKEVRLLGIGDSLLRRWRTGANTLYGEQSELHRRESRAVTIAGAIGTVLFYGAYFGVVAMAVERVISLGEMTMALVLFRQAQSGVQSVVLGLGQLAQDQLYMADLFAFLDRPSPRDDVGLTAGPLPGDGIRLENVSFSYPGTEGEVLRDIDLHLPPGAVVGIVGQNGSGKSTLLKLILGLYEVDAGRITLDGLDLRQWNRRALWRRVAAVFQDFARYKLTIDENIELGDVSETEPVTRASIASGADEVRALLGGERRLGRSFPGGTDLSGGQWQKLALARAFYRESADIRVFDEPTAALDAITEAKVFDQIYSEPGAMTLVVAHRVAVLRRADEIVVLHEGKIAERGTHRSLLESGGRYAELFALQAESYVPA
ncbi:MAG: ABC transporter ATP-binding protein [Myxococcota bacterium]